MRNALMPIPLLTLGHNYVTVDLGIPEGRPLTRQGYLLIRDARRSRLYVGTSEYIMLNLRAEVISTTIFPGTNDE